MIDILKTDIAPSLYC